MERGFRALTEPVDDAIENKNVFDEVLKPFIYVRGEKLPNQELYVSSASTYGVEIKNGDRIWDLDNNILPEMIEEL